MCDGMFIFQTVQNSKHIIGIRVNRDVISSWVAFIRMALYVCVDDSFLNKALKCRLFGGKSVEINNEVMILSLILSMDM